jgi:hypothetical protein
MVSVDAVPTVPVTVTSVPGAAVQATRRERVNAALAPAGTLAREHETAPVPPAGGVAQVQPDAAESDWNVVPAGTGNEAVASMAASGPLFATVKT